MVTVLPNPVQAEGALGDVQELTLGAATVATTALPLIAVVAPEQVIVARTV